MKAKACCPHCGTRIVEYKHKINSGLAYALCRLLETGGKSKASKLGLDHVVINNFHKLAYWNLMTPGPDRTWQITDVGKLFLSGKMAVPEYAISIKGKVKKLEGKLVTIRSYLDKKYWGREEYVVNSICDQSNQEQNPSLFQ